MSTLKANVNRKSIEATLKKHEKLMMLLFRMKEKSAKFRECLVKDADGIKLAEMLKQEQQYVWVRVGMAEHMYPVFSDHRKTESVAYIAEDTDFVKRNTKDTRFSWRVLGRAGTDQNGWCRTRTQAKENCEKYFNVLSK